MGYSYESNDEGTYDILDPDGDFIANVSDDESAGALIAYLDAGDQKMRVKRLGRDSENSPERFVITSDGTYVAYVPSYSDGSVLLDHLNRSLN